MIKNKKKIIFDWNGTLVNDANIFVDVLNEILLSRNLPAINYKKYREMLIEGKRDIEPCNKCNINGTATCNQPSDPDTDYRQRTECGVGYQNEDPTVGTGASGEIRSQVPYTYISM